MLESNRKMTLQIAVVAFALLASGCKVASSSGTVFLSAADPLDTIPCLVAANQKTARIFGKDGSTAWFWVKTDSGILYCQQASDGSIAGWNNTPNATATHQLISSSSNDDVQFEYK